MTYLRHYPPRITASQSAPQFHETQIRAVIAKQVAQFEAFKKAREATGFISFVGRTAAVWRLVGQIITCEVYVPRTKR